MHLELLENRMLLAGDGITDFEHNHHEHNDENKDHTHSAYVDEHTKDHLNHPYSIAGTAIMFSAGALLGYTNTGTANTALAAGVFTALTDLAAHAYCCETNTPAIAAAATAAGLSTASGITAYKARYSNPTIAAAALAGFAAGIASHACCYLVPHSMH